MSRPLRIIYEGAWYHVMNRGSRGATIFYRNEDYQRFIDLLCESSRMWQVRIAAYCLMSNHYHLLLQTLQANLPRCMRHINGIYTQRYNRMYNSEGQLFRGRYKAILIDADSYLLELVRYIHRNPLRVGIVNRLDDYAWSSHRGYISTRREWNWLYKDFVLDMLELKKSRQRRAYRTFVALKDNKEILQFFQRKNLPAMLGKDWFVDKIKKKHFKEKQHKEIPESKWLAPDVITIKQAVCRAYGEKPERLFKSKRGKTNEARNVAVYLIRKHTGEKLERIGKEFNIPNYSTISSVLAKVASDLKKNKKLRELIEVIEKQVLKSQ